MTTTLQLAMLGTGDFAVPTFEALAGSRHEVVALITQHSRALRDKAHKFIARQGSLPDQIIEGLLYIADHGRRDPFTRNMVNLDGTDLGRRMVASRTSEVLVSEFWDPFLDAAVKAGELPDGLARPDLHLWLRDICLLIMRGLEERDGDVQRYRAILRTFVAPAFTARPSGALR